MKRITLCLRLLYKVFGLLAISQVERPHCICYTWSPHLNLEEGPCKQNVIPK